MMGLMKISDIADQVERELVSREEIDRKIAETAKQISQDYAGRDLLLVGVLKGAANTLVALADALSIDVEIDYVKLSSYGAGTESSGTVTVRNDLSCDVRGRNVLVVEDIVDTGRTLAWFCKELDRRGAASVETFALFDKPARRTIDFHPKYQGILIPDVFAVGFGLDYAEKYRNLDSVAVLKPSVYSKETNA